MLKFTSVDDPLSDTLIVLFNFTLQNICNFFPVNEQLENVVQKHR